MIKVMWKRLFFWSPQNDGRLGIRVVAFHESVAQNHADNGRSSVRITA